LGGVIGGWVTSIGVSHISEARCGAAALVPGLRSGPPDLVWFDKSQWIVQHISHPSREREGWGTLMSVIEVEWAISRATLHSPSPESVFEDLSLAYLLRKNRIPR
jgi:hypothetical protein